MSESKKSTKKLSKFVSETNFEDVPEEVIEKTKLLVLDTIGCSLAGSQTDQGSITANLMEELGGEPTSTVLANKYKISSTNAAFVNAKMSNALDFDDAFMNRTHFAGQNIFSPLAVGEKVGATGKDFITAIALGYDISARFVISTGPWDEFHMGDQRDIPKFEEVSPGLQQIQSVFGAAAATSKILGLERSGIENAWGIAGSSAPMCNTKFEPPKFYFMTKYQEFGFIAQTAIMSALLAERGYDSPKNIFDDPGGFYQKLGLDKGKFSYDHFTRKMGEKWWIMKSQIKYYPVCRWTNGLAYCMEKIVGRENIKPDQIEKIIAKSFPLFFKPAYVNQDPRGGPDTQFSVPHAIAMVAFGVEPGLEWHISKWVENPEVENFRKKVEIEYNPEFKEVYEEYTSEELKSIYNAHGFRRIPHIVKVKTKEEEFTEKTYYAPGDPWTSETKSESEDIVEKFRKNANNISRPPNNWEQKIEKIIDKTTNLEQIDNLNELTELFF